MTFDLGVYVDVLFQVAQLPAETYTLECIMEILDKYGEGIGISNLKILIEILSNYNESKLLSTLNDTK